MKKHESKEKKRRALEEEDFQAYGEYSYSFLHEKTSPQDGGEAREQPTVSLETIKRNRKKRGSHRLRNALIIIFIITVALIVTVECIFRLDNIWVLGNQKKTPAEIVIASGLTRGISLFRIHEEDVKKAIESDHSLIFKGMQIQPFHDVYIYVEERESVAVIHRLGTQYELDEDGMVMSETDVMDIPEGMPLVNGFHVISARVGQPLSVRSQKQLQVFRELLRELDLQQCRDQVVEINLFTADNYYLITKEGITVRLGDGSYLRAKVGAMRTDIAYLRQLGQNAGILDVSIPEDAKFLPED